MKSLKQEYIKKNLSSCLNLSREQNKIIIYSNQINSDEYLINVIFLKGYFIQKTENRRNIDTDLLFILHLVHNFPINEPKLFCMTSLSHIGIEIGDGKDILEEVLQSQWDSKISVKNIILKIPIFIQNCLESNINKLFVGKYILDYAYDYNVLIKIPHQYFNIVEQIINVKTGKTEKRFLMITSLFFLVFSYKSGYFSYNELKLVFWASIFSIYGMKKDEPTFEFEFIKNNNQRITIYLNTKECVNIMNVILYIFQARGVDYLVQGAGQSHKLPGMDINGNDKNNEKDEHKDINNKENGDKETKLDENNDKK